LARIAISFTASTGIQRARGAQVDAVGRRLEAAGGRHRVLLRERGEHHRGLDAEGRELRVGELHEDLLVLLADQVHLGHVLHAQELVADAIRGLLQLRIGEAVARERVDVAERVAELVVEERALDPLGQAVADVADLLAHLVPRVPDLVGPRRVLHEDEDHRFAGLRVAPQEIEPRRLLELPLDPVGELALDFLGRRRRPQGAHHHQLEREVGIFRLPRRRYEPTPTGGQHDHEVEHQRLVRQRPLGKVEALQHRASVLRLQRRGQARRIGDANRLTARSLCTPAVTTTSPGREPAGDRDAVLAELPTVTGFMRTWLVEGSTTQTDGCARSPASADSGSSTSWLSAVGVKRRWRSYRAAHRPAYRSP
jgi:hypothetical protein